MHHLCALLDESISLSSAIQLSGYPSVVGSLWKISDKHSAEITRDVYTWILEAGCVLNVKTSSDNKRDYNNIGSRNRNRRSTTFCLQIMNENSLHLRVSIDLSGDMSLKSSSIISNTKSPPQRTETALIPIY